MKSGGKKMASRKMKMGGSFIEPDKELKFGGVKKYGNGGEDEELKAASKEIYQSMTWEDAKELGKTKQWLAANPEKAKKIKEESNKAFAADADVRAAQRAVANRGNKGTDKIREASEKVVSNNTAARAAEKRGPSRQEKQNTPQGTSQNNKAKGQSPASKPASTPAKKPAAPAASPRPKAAPAAMNKVQAKSVPMKTSAQIEAARPKPTSPTKVMLSGMSQKGTTKGKGEAEARFAGATKATKSATGASGSNQLKSKSAPSSVSKRADRINKRADRVENRKNKKAAISEAKARLKAARRLKSGGLKTPTEDQKGLQKLPTAVRNKMGYKKYGGKY